MSRPDGPVVRCAWALSSPDYLAYHDQEWGRPVHGTDALFERMSLEAFQSGLSWLTILRKREAFRAAFAGFRVAELAAFTATDADRLMANTGIVRNRAKIDAVLANARTLAEQDIDLDGLLWSFAPVPRPPRPADARQVHPTSPASVAMAAELRRRGIRFVGPTTAHALMQATGMVDDHIAGCVVVTDD